MPASDPQRPGATVVISHRVRPGMIAAYEAWLGEIEPACRASAGYLDSQVIRPIPEVSTSYTVLIGFDSAGHIRDWMESDDRRRLIDLAKPFLDTDDAYAIHSGLDFWFVPKGSTTQTPVRWKQFLVTWSAIYPLGVAVPMLVAPLMTKLGITNIAIITLPITAIMVSLMVYLIMPRYTNLMRRWLYA